MVKMSRMVKPDVVPAFQHHEEVLLLDDHVIQLLYDF